VSVLFPNSAPGLVESRLRAADDSRDWRAVVKVVALLAPIGLVLLVAVVWPLAVMWGGR
jgi:hypothetical protein